MCTLKSENKICWSFYVFFDLVVISSVLAMLDVYCSIVDFIEIRDAWLNKKNKKNKKNQQTEILRYRFLKHFFL